MKPLSGKRAIVIGAGFGGLSAAIHLAHRGANVTVYERAKSVGGKAAHFEKNGFVFDAGPTLLTMPEEVLSLFELASAKELAPKIVPVDPISRSIFASGKEITIHRDIERTTREIACVDAQDAEAFPRFLDECARVARLVGAPYLDAPYDGAAEFAVRVMKGGLSAVRLGVSLGTLHELACERFRSPEMRMLVGRFATYAGGSPYESSAAFSMIADLELRGGAFYPEGGMHDLARRIAEAARRAGVTIVLERDVTGLAGDSAVVNGIRLGHEEVRADLVVADVDPCLDWLNAPRSPPARRVPSLSAFVLALGIEGAPPSSSAHTVLFASDYRLEFDAIFEEKAVAREPTIYLSVPTLLDPARAPAGHHVVFVLVNAPAAHDATHWERTAPQLEEMLLATIERRLAPGLTSRIVERSVRTPIDLRETGSPFGEIYGAAPHGRLAPFERQKNRADRRGLYFVGGASHPGGGVPMVIRSGRFVADLVERDGA